LLKVCRCLNKILYKYFDLNRTSNSIIALPDETVLDNGVEPDIEVITKRGIGRDALIDKVVEILN